MPANPKYLNTSSSQKFAKISAAILGGFLLTVSFHLMLASLLSDQKTVLVTYSYSLFLVWTPLILLPFFFDNGWKCWLWYASFTFLFSFVFLIYK